MEKEHDEARHRYCIIHGDSRATNRQQVHSIITMQPTLQTAAKLLDVKTTWDAIFQKTTLNNKKRRRKSKKTKKVIWTDKQRAEWARSHYLQHYGPCSTSTTTPNPTPSQHKMISNATSSLEHAASRIDKCDPTYGAGRREKGGDLVMSVLRCPQHEQCSATLWRE